MSKKIWIQLISLWMFIAQLDKITSLAAYEKGLLKKNPFCIILIIISKVIDFHESLIELSVGKLEFY